MEFAKAANSPSEQPKKDTEKIDVFKTADDVQNIGNAIGSLANGDLSSLKSAGDAANRLSKMSMGDLKNAAPSKEELAE